MILYKYGVAADLYFPLIKRGTMDFALAADYTHASGDVKISKDGGTAATATNSPSAITLGNGAMWKLTLTATEMQAAQIVVTIVDAATKAVEDQMIIIQTYGNASAQHPFDLGTASTPQTGDNYARIGAPVGASISADIAGVQSDTNDIQTRIPAALTGAGNMKADALAINGSTSAATQLAKSGPTIVSGTAITGTLSNTQASTDLTEVTNDHYVGRSLVWTSGVLQNQACYIEAYNGTSKVLTYTTTPTGESPSNNDTFIIV